MNSVILEHQERRTCSNYRPGYRPRYRKGLACTISKLGNVDWQRAQNRNQTSQGKGREPRHIICTYPSNKLLLLSLSPLGRRVISMAALILRDRFIVTHLSALGEHVACPIVMGLVRVTTNRIRRDLLLVGRGIGAKRHLDLLGRRSRHDCRSRGRTGDEAVGDNGL